MRASANLTGSSPDGRVLQSSGLGQEGGAFTPDIREPLGLDGSEREMPCWEEKLSSAEAIPRRGCAESIRPSFLTCDLRYASPCLPQGDASRYFADIQGNPWGPRLLGPPLFKVPCRTSPQKLLLIFFNNYLLSVQHAADTVFNASIMAMSKHKGSAYILEMMGYRP